MRWLLAFTDELDSQQYDLIYNSLSASRKAHIDHMKQPNDRKNSLLATWLINKLLIDRGINNAVLETDSNGRPFLKENNLFISISHCEKAVVCVVSETAVGIDIEKQKPVKPSLIDYVCTREEKAYIMEDKALSQRRFFEIWTAKEAYFKKCGDGLKNMLSTNILPIARQIYTVDDYVITVT